MTPAARRADASDLDRLRARERQQRAVAELGFQALSMQAFADLIDAAAQTIATTLGVGMVWIAELQEERDLVVRAGLGIEDDAVTAVRLPGGEESLSGYTMTTAGAVVSEDLACDPRFTPAGRLLELGARSAVTVQIGSAERPYGVLGASATTSGHFSADDVAFMETVANMLATALQRVEAQEAARLRAEQYRSMLATTTDGFFVFDTNARIVDVNDAYCRMSGYSREELLRMSIGDIEATMGEGEIRELIQRHAPGRFGVFETRHRAKDGHIFDVEVSAAAAGRDRGVVFIRDISSRKRREAEFAHMRAVLDRTQAVAKVGGWEYDVQGRTATWTDETYRIYGAEQGTRDPADIEASIRAYEGAGASALADAFQRATTTGEPYDLTLGLNRDDGHRIWVRTTCEAVLDDGRVARLGGTIADITEQKLAQLRAERVQRLYRTLAAATEAIMRASDPAELLDSACASIVRDGGARMARALLFGDGDAGAPTLAEAGGLDEARSPDVTLHLRREDTPIGELALYCEDAALDEDQLRLFEALAEDISFGLTALSREQARRRAEERLAVSEELFRGAFEDSPTGMVLTNLNWTNRRVNAAFARMLGYGDPGELEGTATAAIVHPDDRPLVERAYEEMLEDRPASVEIRGLRHDGSSVETLVSATLIRDLSGEPWVMFSHVQDISQRKREQAALRAARERLQSVIDHAPSLIYLIDPDARLLLVNDALERRTGRRREDLVGRSRDEVFPAPVVLYHRPYDAQVLRTKQAVEFEMSVDVPEPGVFLSVKFPLLGEDGEVYAVGAISTDITERKRAELEVRRLNAELERRVVERTVELAAANRELEAFVYSVSHDLRAPLRAVDGFSRLLLEGYGGRLDQRGQHYLSRVQAGVGRMGTMIEDLLALSRVSRGELRRERVDLSAVAGSVVSELRSVEPGREVECVVGDGLVVRGDPGLLRVVLENLLSNAWKFTSARERARIEVGECVVDGERVFFVRDDGVGFDMAYAADLFKPFGRLHDLREFPGTGIGLASVQRIVSRHGGRVWAESVVGAGATFNFTLGEPGPPGA